MRDRPCLWQCNRTGCSPTKCLGRRVYDKDDPRAWLGRGYENVPGKPFGWAHVQERTAIRAHLSRRGMVDSELFFRIGAIQRRLHREAPTMRERQAAWKARQPAPPAEAAPFTPEELGRLVELFDGANDPVTASIAAKAAYRLASNPHD